MLSAISPYVPQFIRAFLRWLDQQPPGRQQLYAGLLIAAICTVFAVLWKVIVWASQRIPRVRTEPPSADWHSIEQRFEKVPIELWAMWSVFDDGHVEWSVYSNDYPSGYKRAIERFLGEARYAGRHIRKQGIQGRFALKDPNDDADVWLNVVALTHPGKRITGSGHDHGVYRETASIENIVDASKVTCARLAGNGLAGARNQTIADALTKRLIHGQQIAAWTLFLEDDFRDFVARKNEWLQGTLREMKAIGCTLPEQVSVGNLNYSELQGAPEFKEYPNEMWNEKKRIMFLQLDKLRAVIDHYQTTARV